MKKKGKIVIVSNINNSKGDTMNIHSIIIFLVVLLFLEFCVFCYFHSNIFRTFSSKRRRTKDDDEYDIGDLEFPEEHWESDELSDEEMTPLIFADEKWEVDELSDDELGVLSFQDEKWKDDSIAVDIDEVNKLLFEIDPDFKLDLFYLSVYDIYAIIAANYSDDKLKEVSNLMSKELYQANVRQLDSFRKRNLQHIVEIRDYINCSILDAKIIDSDLYVKVELKVSCYDYIINRASKKIVRGIGNKELFSVYRLILKRKLTKLHCSKVTERHDVLPVVTNSSDLNDDNWVLTANKIICRRVNK